MYRAWQRKSSTCIHAQADRTRLPVDGNGRWFEGWAQDGRGRGAVLGAALRPMHAVGSGGDAATHVFDPHPHNKN
jgi:hypothetical protein